jgi:glucosamine--fructose-6-phosphate aminotransferase (isomerizing)
MEAEILEQPSLLVDRAGQYIEQLRHLTDARPELILLVARGSSDHAALYARYLIEIHLEIPAVLAAPSVWTRYSKRPRYPRTLAIGISQSGAAPDVAETLLAMREDGHATLAITNTPGSRVSEAAACTLLLDVGEERSIAATKTYMASLLALFQVVRALGAVLPEMNLPDEDWCASARSFAEAASGPVVRSNPLFALARGYDFCTAHETALKLMECALMPCKAYSLADFEHGPKALTGPGSAAVVFGGVPDWLIRSGSEVVTPPTPPVAEPLRPLWNAFYGQWLALLAARARGLDPDRARNLLKVTETM